MNILFLDFDGVVNTPMWDNNHNCKYNFPEDGKVNNFQACQWVSEFCEKYNYKIVVTSTWRKECTVQQLRDILYNGGLRDDVEIIGKTPFVHYFRDREILEWFGGRKDVEKYMIFDDENYYDKCKCLKERFVQCRDDCGFLNEDYDKAVKIHRSN